MTVEEKVGLVRLYNELPGHAPLDMAMIEAVTGLSYSTIWKLSKRKNHGVFEHCLARYMERGGNLRIMKRNFVKILEKNNGRLV